MRLSEKRLETVMRQNGYKITPQRRAVILAITSNQDHLTPAAIYHRVHKELPNIGLVTIYRTLELLIKLELICELHTDGCPSYTIGASGHHHHLICTHCGTVTDFSDPHLNKLEQRLVNETGFKIKGHMLEFTGICQSCQKATPRNFTKLSRQRFLLQTSEEKEEQANNERNS